MVKVIRNTLDSSLNLIHNLSSSKGSKPLQLKLLTTYIPKTTAFPLAFSTSQRLRTTRASARTFFTFRYYITPSARNFFFFFQAEDGIRDRNVTGVQTCASSDLAIGESVASPSLRGQARSCRRPAPGSPCRLR